MMDDESIKTKKLTKTLMPTSAHYKYSVTILAHPVDKNNVQISDATINEAVKFAFSVWSSAVNVSFEKVSSPANINITFDHHCTFNCNAGGDASIKVYCYTSCNYPIYDPIYMDFNSIMSVMEHEIGHVLGLPDFMDPTISNNGIFPPSPRVQYWRDYSYWDWRMRGFGSGFGNYQVPTNYNMHKDVSLSICDYNAGGEDRYLPPNYNVGMWGRPTGVWQPQYLSQYDINMVGATYGTSNYVPILPMALHLDWSNVNYHGSAGGYVTTSWDDVNCKVRQYQMPSDLKYVAGLAWKSNNSSNTRKNMFRWYNPSFKTYTVATSTPGTGWLKQNSLGWWEKNQSTVSVVIGTKTISTQSIPIYAYYNPNKSLVYIAIENITISGFTKTIVGYIFPGTKITL